MAELRENREAEEKAAAAAVSVPTSIVSFIGYHLACKAEVVGRRRPSQRELNLLRTRLIHAGMFFRRQGIHDLRELTPGVVTAYTEHLHEEVRNVPGHAGRRVNYLSPATQRKYLAALRNMLKRARSKGLIHANFVADIVAVDGC
ncbi:phage integrase SAM-like domain-containing protein [Longimicrobium sp.]|uniref:phage integrase SAM-like domain-containing protein n=1 Tax=Longimicrobium sp. TaxID=2029185 RepID=UPI002EDB2A70